MKLNLNLLHILRNVPSEVLKCNFLTKADIRHFYIFQASSLPSCHRLTGLHEALHLSTLHSLGRLYSSLNIPKMLYLMMQAWAAGRKTHFSHSLYKNKTETLKHGRQGQ